MQPALNRGQLRCPPTEVDTCRHHSEHAGRLRRVRGDEREVPGHQRDRHLDRRVVQTPPNGGDQEPDNDADSDAADYGPEEVPRGIPEGEGARNLSRDGHPIEHQSSPVVHQRLALDDRDDAARNS